MKDSTAKPDQFERRRLQIRGVPSERRESRVGEPCRNQGAALAEKPCGYCHEGPCDPSSFVVLRRFDVEALLEEWGDLDEDPFWKPLGDSVRIVAAGWSEGDALSRLASVTRERDEARDHAILAEKRSDLLAGERDALREAAGSALGRAELALDDLCSGKHFDAEERLRLLIPNLRAALAPIEAQPEAETAHITAGDAGQSEGRQGGA